MSGLKGQLLLEVLVVLGVAVTVIALGAQIVTVSLQGSKGASEKDVALALLEETFEAVRNAATEKWQNLYGLTKGATAYYPQKLAGRWVLTLGTESLVINDITYTRSFTVQNVCRNTTTKDITGITDSNGSTTTCTTNGGNDDPSTQRLTVNINWPNAETLTSNEYVERWRNKICPQTSWTTGGNTSVTTCSTTSQPTTYDTKTNITASTDLQLCSGGC